MRTGFWIKRFLQVYAAAFLIVGVGRWLRTGDLQSAFRDSAAWSLLAAAIFIGNGIWRTTRGDNSCPVCRDTAEPN